MVTINIKPLSVNECWQGRRFKTRKYDAYSIMLQHLLPKMEIPEGMLQVFIEFGFSSSAADVDNPLKPFIDTLQVKYGFNDKQIKRLIVSKELVKKGNEYIKFEITKL